MRRAPSMAGTLALLFLCALVVGSCSGSLLGHFAITGTLNVGVTSTGPAR